jgi:PQQ-dependent catabolism-associated CXXCW motif protein
MTRRISTLALVLLGSAAFTVCGDRSAAQQETPSGYTAQAGGWYAKANFDSNGKLLGCAAKRSSNADGLSIMVLPGEAWALNLSSRELELELEKPIPIDITFDGRSQYHLFGLPSTKNAVLLRMQAGSVTEQFRKAESLSVFLQGKYFSFSLAGTSRLLPALTNCVRTNGTLAKLPDAELVATRPPTFYYGDEDVDYKVPPQETLKRDVSARTPLTVPGISTVTTTGLMDAMLSGQRMVLIDALESNHVETIKGAVSLPFAGAYGDGTFHDQVQTRLVDALNGLLQGREGASLVFFCEGVECWESYNAVLRARAAGFKNVAWYRGGLDAWKGALFPLQPKQMATPPAKPADAAPVAMPASPPDSAPIAMLTKPADAAPVPLQPNQTDVTPAKPPVAAPVATSAKPPAAALAATHPSTAYYGDENVDYKVRPQNTLRRDVGTRTPLTVPGVTTVTTTEIMDAMQHGRPMILIDALQGHHSQTIQDAVSLPYAGAYGTGTFHDQVQTRVAKALNDLVQGREGASLIFFCEGSKCWESYNAALRARAAGFQNVSWYRGGLDAWEEAGFPLQPNE